jgi:GNAT superfamily N-acetyltransferase
LITIEKIDTTSKEQVRQFTRFPFRLYKNYPQWVSPLLVDAEMQLNRNKHPFFEHSEADFFLAKREGKIVGRIAVAVNISFNKYHDTKQAQFYLFDCEDDQEAASALFENAFDWARERKLNRVVGPKGFGPLDGYGILVEGFEQRQMMNMMSYNYPYYPKLIEAVGFEKEVDFVCCHLNTEKFHLPERIHRIAERVQKRGTLNVKTFSSKKELRSWADRIGKAYNNAFVNNWEYYPLTENEIKFVLENILVIAIPKLIKVITHGDDVVGFLFGFPDVSAAMQRARGKLLPLGILDILIDLRRTKLVALNGAGILPEFQGMGGNALLYSEIDKTVHEHGFIDAELVQVAETAVQMRSDLVNIGAVPYKNHRVYRRDL